MKVWTAERMEIGEDTNFALIGVYATRDAARSACGYFSDENGYGIVEWVPTGKLYPEGDVPIYGHADGCSYRIVLTEVQKRRV